MKILVDVDKQINTDIRGNNNMTISKQCARGLQKRLNYAINESEAMNRAHGNMIISGITIVAGIYLFKSSPLLGLTCIIIGGSILGRIVHDWQDGRCNENIICA